MQMKWAALVLIAALPAVGQKPDSMIAAVEGPQVPNRQGMDALTMKEVMERLHVPGVSVAVIWDFKIHWAKSWGLADVENRAPVTNDTMFQAASRATRLCTLRFRTTAIRLRAALKRATRRRHSSTKSAF